MLAELDTLGPLLLAADPDRAADAVMACAARALACGGFTEALAHRRSMLAELDTLGPLLLAADPDRAADAVMACAARALARGGFTEALHRDGRAPLRALAARTAGVDHIGFLASGVPLARLAAAARAHGFDAPRAFASEVLSRELSARAGGPVATTVFKATGALGGVEVFLPEAPRAAIERWIAAGVGRHVALCLADVGAVAAAAEGLREAGFTLPPGLDPVPMVHAAEGVVLTYRDGAVGPHAVRIELCHRLGAGG